MSTFLMTEQRPTFVEQYNKTCFMFDHRLNENSIFDLPNLVDLAKRLPDSYWSTNEVAVEGGWGTAPKARLSLPETVATAADSNSLILLKGLAADAEFGPIYHAVLSQIEDQVGEALRSDISIGRATLVISSPHRITPYHIDAEVNFLLQLRGEKTANIFDPHDRTLLTDTELEAFYSGDCDAAKYKHDRQEDAYVFELAPGKGIHLPLHAPHWTRNGNSVSVGLSVNCSLRSNTRAARIYRFNRMLRNQGFTPLPPGASDWQDRVKAVALRGIECARNLKRATKREPIPS